MIRVTDVVAVLEIIDVKTHVAILEMAGTVIEFRIL